MNYLFYGDQFFVEQRLLHWKREFSSKHGSENIMKFQCAQLDTKEITEAIWWWGLFAMKKMIIIEGLPPDTTSKYNESTKKQMDNFYEYLITHQSTIPEDNLIIFISTTPDKKTKRAKLFLNEEHDWIKVISHEATSKEILKYIQEHSDGLIAWANAQRLIDLCNKQMYTIDNEIKKIKSYLSWSSIQLTEKILDDIVISDKQIDVWSFIDGIIINQDPQTINKFITYSQQDNNSFQFLWLLYWSIGWMIYLIDSREHGITDPSELASKSKLPPFTISRYNAKKNQLITSKNQLHHIYKNLLEMDYNLKTGMLPAEGFWVWIGWILMDKNYHENHVQ